VAVLGGDFTLEFCVDADFTMLHGGPFL
jgi:hypothetical protein